MGISRRSFLKLASASALGASLPQKFFVPALLQASKTITVGINASTTLDPHLIGESQISLRTHNHLFDQLTFLGYGGSPEPMLATEWVNDGLEWRFKLRDDVIFHDGSMMTADDVAFSLNRLVFGEEESAARAAYAPYIASIDVVDDYEIAITSTNTDPFLPMRLASTTCSIMPRAHIEANDTATLSITPVGSGPYKFVEYTPGERLVLEQHSEYWQGTPPATEVILRAIPELAVRVGALLTGEVDFITTISPDLIGQVNDNEGTKVLSEAQWNWMDIILNMNAAPLDNANVRRAMTLGVDRQTIVDSLWSSLVRPLNDYYMPNQFGYDSSRPVFPFDPDEAARALEAAGYDGSTIVFGMPVGYYTNSDLVTQVIADQWQSIGLNIDYQPTETGPYWGSVLEGEIPAFLVSHSSRGEARSFIQLWNPGTFFGGMFVPPAGFAELANEAFTSLDPDVRYTNYRAIADLWDQTTPFVPLYQSVEFYGMRDDINWRVHPEYIIDFRPGILEL